MMEPSLQAYVDKDQGDFLHVDSKERIAQIKASIDRATSDYLTTPDWNANVACVELINPAPRKDILVETVLHLRKRLTTKKPTTTLLALHLLGSLVNNCDSRFHDILDSESFTNDMMATARYYSKHKGADNKEVLTLCLQLVQSWGEAFLPRRSQFPYLVDLYSTLRMEGMPFKPRARASDESRDGPAHRTERNAATYRSKGGVAKNDAAIAAALQSSIIESNSQNHKATHRRDVKQTKETHADILRRVYGSDVTESALPDSSRPANTHHHTRSRENSRAGSNNGSKNSSREASPWTGERPAGNPGQAGPSSSNHAQNPPPLRQPYPSPQQRPFPPMREVSAPSSTGNALQYERPPPPSREMSAPMPSTAAVASRAEELYAEQRAAVEAAMAARRAAAGEAGVATGAAGNFQQQYRQGYDWQEPELEVPPHRQRRVSESAVDVVQRLRTSMAIMRDMVIACSSQQELQQSDIGPEMLQEILSYQSKMSDIVDEALVNDPDNVEKLLKVNEDAQALALLFKRMKSGALSLLAGKMQIRSLGLGDSEKSPANGKGLSTAAAMLARSLSRSSSGIILPSSGGGVSRSSSGPIGRSGSSSRDQHDPDSIRSREGSFDSPGGGLPLRSASVDSGLPLSGERGIRLGFPTCKPGTPGGGTGTGTGTRIPETSTGTSPVISPPGSRHGTQPSSAQGSRHTSRSSSKDEDDDRDHQIHHRHHDADPSRYHARAGSVEDSIGFKDRASSFDEEDGPLGNAGHTAAYNDGQQRRHHHHQRQQQHDRVVSTRSGVDAVELVALLEQGAHIEGEVDDYGRWIHKTNDHHAPPFDRRSPAKPSHSAAPAPAPAPSPAPAPAPAALDGVTSLPLPAGAARVLAAHDSDASEVIVHERDPFAPEALDALFTAGSASKAPHHGCGHGHQQRERSTGQRPRKELDAVREDDGNVGTGTGTGNGSSDHRGGGERSTGEDRSNEAEAVATTQDPFAAEALDALFVSKTVGSADTYEDSGKYSQRSPATRPQQHPQQQRQPQHPSQPPYRGDNRPHQQQQQYYQEHHRDHPHYQQQHGFNERMNAEEAAHHRYGAQAHPHLQAQTVHPSREQSPNPPQRHAPISAAGTARAPAARSTADRQGTHSPYPTEHRSRSPRSPHPGGSRSPHHVHPHQYVPVHLGAPDAHHPLPRQHQQQQHNDRSPHPHAHPHHHQQQGAAPRLLDPFSDENLDKLLEYDPHAEHFTYVSSTASKLSTPQTPIVPRHDLPVLSPEYYSYGSHSTATTTHLSVSTPGGGVESAALAPSSAVTEVTHLDVKSVRGRGEHGGGPLQTEYTERPLPPAPNVLEHPHHPQHNHYSSRPHQHHPHHTQAHNNYYPDDRDPGHDHRDYDAESYDGQQEQQQQQQQQEWRRSYASTEESSQVEHKSDEPLPVPPSLPTAGHDSYARSPNPTGRYISQGASHVATVRKHHHQYYNQHQDQHHHDQHIHHNEQYHRPVYEDRGVKVPAVSLPSAGAATGGAAAGGAARDTSSCRSPYEGRPLPNTPREGTQSSPASRRQPHQSRAGVSSLRPEERPLPPVPGER